MQYRRRHRLLFEALIDQSDNLVDDGVVIALVLLCARKPCLGSELFPNDVPSPRQNCICCRSSWPNSF